jgi:hypothetical protein
VVPYVLVFFGSLGVDLIPIMAPPAWTVMAFAITKYQLNPWIALAIGVPASALAGTSSASTSEVLRSRAGHEEEELNYCRQEAARALWETWVFVLGYTLSPLSTTALFTAAWHEQGAGLAPILPSFLVGKFISDAMMVKAGQYAAGKSEGHGARRLQRQEHHHRGHHARPHRRVSVRGLARAARQEEPALQLQHFQVRRT